MTSSFASNLPFSYSCGYSDLEYLWSECIHVLGLQSATILSQSTYDFARRTYFYENRVYKILLLKWDLTKSQRQHTLAGEFAFVKHCKGIAGIPKVLKYQKVGDFEAAVFSFFPGRPLAQVCPGLFRMCAILVRLSLIIYKISMRGISHNDIVLENVLVSDDGKISLIDFDQATQVPIHQAFLRNFLGLGGAVPPVCGSLITIFKRQIEKHLPPHAVQSLKRVNDFVWPPPVKRLPKLPNNASPKLKTLMEAWRLAQLSDANSPGQNLSYYSLQFDGYHFPGERPWEERWQALKGITDYRGKRILEIGCNLSLLSCFLLKKAGAGAALAVDSDPAILSAARKVAYAFDVSPVYIQMNFDYPNEWETDLIKFQPDIVFALNVLNWVEDRKRLMSFLGKFCEVIFEGHESLAVETSRFQKAGFDKINLVAISERSRPILYCQKQTTQP